MTTIHANYSLQSNNLFSLILAGIRITLIRSYYGQRDSTLEIIAGTDASILSS